MKLKPKSKQPFFKSLLFLLKSCFRVGSAVLTVTGCVSKVESSNSKATTHMFDSVDVDHNIIIMGDFNHIPTTPENDLVVNRETFIDLFSSEFFNFLPDVDKEGLQRNVREDAENPDPGTEENK